LIVQQPNLNGVLDLGWIFAGLDSGAGLVDHVGDLHLSRLDLLLLEILEEILHPGLSLYPGLQLPVQITDTQFKRY
jgi:hypothetical protein